jgi:hypothetical protein
MSNSPVPAKERTVAYFHFDGIGLGKGNDDPCGSTTFSRSACATAEFPVASSCVAYFPKSL